MIFKLVDHRGNKKKTEISKKKITMLQTSIEPEGNHFQSVNIVLFVPAYPVY